MGLNIHDKKGKEDKPMNKMIKKVLVGVMAATMMLGSVSTAFAAVGSATVSVEPEKQSGVKAEKTSTGITPTVNTRADGTATVTEVKKTSKKSVTISKTVTVDGVDYKVTKVAAGAFDNCTKVKTITLPSTITTIGSEAFTGVSSTLKTIKINSTKKVTVSKNAFKDVDTKKMTITVTKNMSSKDYKALKKALKAAGFEGTIKRA